MGKESSHILETIDSLKKTREGINCRINQYNDYLKRINDLLYQTEKFVISPDKTVELQNLFNRIECELNFLRHLEYILQKAIVLYYQLDGEVEDYIDKNTEKIIESVMTSASVYEEGPPILSSFKRLDESFLPTENS